MRAAAQVLVLALALTGCSTPPPPPLAAPSGTPERPDAIAASSELLLAGQQKTVEDCVRLRDLRCTQSLLSGPLSGTADAYLAAFTAQAETVGYAVDAPRPCLPSTVTCILSGVDRSRGLGLGVMVHKGDRKAEPFWRLTVTSR